ncbi:MAG: GNAT family N-acetyltransferase [Gammaproteobacteria bacterium]|nr:GNAT family N-acetyltransferase [Gammaproteobacteria bacterium]MBU1442890.1 GNAT family N-acetyltransferase [Gammaproteobacteria bacterium]MBU2289129.1 GNAT family N-acetyltransferase [Gammaproteobacteria bacterium]MBU2409022.1 GNAT family N-acetyltransferase [Gammaproteobacteria bacterium]
MLFGKKFWVESSGWGLNLKPSVMEADDRVVPSSPVMVPIRSLAKRERPRILRHLVALKPHDRYLRFGYAASDEQITRYVDGLSFERDELFGIYNRRLDLIAMAHLAFAPSKEHQGCAEFGVSVSEHARGRGYGARLFERAVVAARNEGVGMLFIHALSENAAMLKIARNAGATVERSGFESEAHLRLPGATFDSRMSEIALERFAQVDYQLKARAQQFWGWLNTLQEIRSGVRSARDQSSP